ncbi:Hypothetical protein D9617_1g088470 [Elsinoe fawcettii]|nr:Hypothetical protein D9617_1g088470 [Elsinoe fawcettii]
MPKFLVPHKHGPHRIAAISLYRALLRSTSLSPISSPQQDDLKTLIRSRFKRNRLNASHRLLGPLFNHAYSVLDALDLSRSQHVATREGAVKMLGRYLGQKRNRTLLERMRYEAGEECKGLQEKERERKRREAPVFEDRGRIWRRPLAFSELTAQGSVEMSEGGSKGTTEKGAVGARGQDDQVNTGKREVMKRIPRRHIPVLFSANKIPVLRFTKPQPRSLSLFLQSRIEQRQRRNDRAIALSHVLRVAEGEDLWDQILEAEHGVTDEVHGKTVLEHGWAGPARGALQEVYDYLETEKSKNAARAKKYVALIDKEKALRQKERQEKVAARNSEVWDRKVERWKAQGVYDEKQDKVADTKHKQRKKKKPNR